MTSHEYTNMMFSPDDFAHLKIPLKNILSATNNFSNRCGKDAFETYYKGQLLWSGELITIYAGRLNKECFDGDQQFWTEVSILSSLKHKNLVSFLGFCDENDEKVTIIKRETRGSLQGNLRDPMRLTWVRRLEISVGIAQALSYIHYDESRDFSVIHCNINSSLIYLNDDWEPKLGDFICSMKIKASERHQSFNTNEVRSRDGYADPTYIETKSVSHKSDMYSFGIVMFELLCGRQAVITGDQDNKYLASVAVTHYREKKLAEIIDWGLLKQMDSQSFNMFAEIAYDCLKEERSQRPDIDEIVPRLVKALELARENRPIHSSPNQVAHLRIPLEEILSATSYFAVENFIGGGGIGKRYKGQLSWSGELINITAQRIYNKAWDDEKEKQFWTEISMLSSLKHKNLVSLVGFCNEVGVETVIYKRDPKGRLDNYLSDPMLLTWVKRLEISARIAHALSYIHYNEPRDFSVIHRNISSETVRLNDEWEPKLSEFQHSIKIKASERHHTFHTDSVWSTKGYTDPTYLETSSVNHKSDIYSFGIVLFELLCGRKSVSDDQDNKDLAPVAIFHYREKILDDIIDPDLLKQMDPRSLNIFAEIAYDCLNVERSQRPNADEIVTRLEKALALQLERENVEHSSVVDEVGGISSSHEKGSTRHFTSTGVESNSSKKTMSSLKYLSYSQLSFKDIVSATNNFALENMIRARTFKYVYQGSMLHSGQFIDIVARGIYPYRKDERKKFRMEKSMLSSLSHINLVSVIGFCDDRRLITVYKKEANGSLNKYLSDETLTWMQRLKICLGVANVLSYIHYDAGRDFSVIHCNVRSSKILLDDEWEPKLSGFELALKNTVARRHRLLLTRDIVKNAYLDPKYKKTGGVTHKSDVYSFGVVLFEVLCGRSAEEEDEDEDEDGDENEDEDELRKRLLLSQLAKSQLDEMIMPHLRKQMDPEALKIFSETAYWCIKEERADRPYIDQVVKRLEKALKFQRKHENPELPRNAFNATSSDHLKVLSLRSCSSFTKPSSFSIIDFRRCSSIELSSLFHLTCFYINPRSAFCTRSKRRSRGPVMAAKKESKGTKQGDGKYKHTVDLPKTTFGMRANSAVREPELQKLWDENQVFMKVAEKNNGGSFILHDGPPYANGDLHIGHALNKIIKDIINRYKLLQNCKVQYVPGWDCHGLPIELKVLQSLDQDARKGLTPIKLRAKAAKFAKATVKAQMASFKRFGVWADWDHPYLTLDPEYEAAQIEVFGQMVFKGYIYRGRKPVHWSPSSRTALAEAELEYEEGHISKSMYAIFKILSTPNNGGLLDEFLPKLSLAIWTTTPWTIPANAAVAVNSKLQYAIVEVQSCSPDVASSSEDKKKRFGSVLNDDEKQFFIVALDLVPTLEAKWGVKLVVKKTVLGSDLENGRYAHPINGQECPVVIGGDYITTESGTGLVHTAPGHGQDDYITGLKYGLPLVSPVDDEGKFTEEAGIFCGLDVLGDGNAAVIDHLDERSSIVMVEPYKHKYPYDWRTKKPTIFRATAQWFASVEGFKEAAMNAINQVVWTPSQAENRISTMTSSRSDWCISRQRTWGVPIPVFYHTETKEPLLNEETVDHIKSIISQKGSDAWWYMSVEELLPEKYRDKASDYVKGTDTMDVWFDSGSSWAAVLESRDGLSYPADLYVEGTDQHRGWFQSSLLTSVATKGQAPYSGVITHGFVLDERGKKMSKSVGNVVDPRTVIEGGKNQEQEPSYGADVLRLWVSSVDFTGDVQIGPQVLRQLSDIYRKLRGTLRFLLGNLHDWKAENSIAYHDLPEIDQHALFQLENVVKNIKESYETYEFFKIYQMIQRFAIVDLSNFYFDVAKDRLYVGGASSFTRRSCQTVLAAHLLSIVRVIAPILPHLAEDVWQNLPFEYSIGNTDVAKFVFESKWPEVNERWLAFPEKDIDFWGNILELRTEVNKALETARTGKLIGSSLEAKVYLHSSDDSLAQRLRNMCEARLDADSLNRIFITSQVEILSTLEDAPSENIPYSGDYLIHGEKKIWIGISRAEGSKCERCWNFSPQVGSFLDHPTLCKRCYDVIAGQPLPALAAVS